MNGVQRFVRQFMLAHLSSACLLICFISSAEAETLTLDRALNQAVESSYDYKIAKLTAGISKTDIKIAKADYFPQVKGYANLEKLRGLTSQPNNVAVVNNSVLPSGSRYQNSGGLNLNQTIWDFGQRHKRVEMAQVDVSSKELQAEQTVRDLKIKVIDAYTEALITFQALNTKQLIVPLYQELFKMNERLVEAGYSSRIQLAEDSILLAKAMDEKQQLSSKLKEQLLALSQYTHMDYDTADLELSDLDVEEAPENENTWEAEKSLEAKVYRLEIDKKEKEVSLLKRQYLPQLSGYTYYNLYGSSPVNVTQSIHDTQSRSWTLGLNMNIPLFDGFKLQGQIEKAKLEAERLKIEREKRLAEIKQKADEYKLQTVAADQLLLAKKDWVEQVKDKLEMMQRLVDEQLVDKPKVVKDTIQQIESDFETYKVEVQKAAAVKKLAVIYLS